MYYNRRFTTMKNPIIRCAISPTMAYDDIQPDIRNDNTTSDVIPTTEKPTNEEIVCYAIDKTLTDGPINDQTDVNIREDPDSNTDLIHDVEPTVTQVISHHRTPDVITTYQAIT